MLLFAGVTSSTMATTATTKPTTPSNPPSITHPSVKPTSPPPITTTLRKWLLLLFLHCWMEFLYYDVEMWSSQIFLGILVKIRIEFIKSVRPAQAKWITVACWLKIVKENFIALRILLSNTQYRVVVVVLVTYAGGTRSRNLYQKLAQEMCMKKFHASSSVACTRSTHRWPVNHVAWSVSVSVLACVHENCTTQKICTRLTNTRASFLSKRTCTRFWYKFLELVSPTLFCTALVLFRGRYFVWFSSLTPSVAVWVQLQSILCQTGLSRHL